MSNRLRALRRRKVFAPLFCSAVAARGGAGIANAETTTWVAAVVGDGGSVSAGRQTLVDNLITSLKSASIWTKLDRLWLFAAENSQSALRDIVTAAAATATSSPTFAADRGYTGDGSASFINSGFNASSAPSPQFTLNSASHFGWCRTTTALQKPIVGTVSAFNSYIYNRLVGDTFDTKVNTTGAAVTGASTDASGLWVANRSALGAQQLYRNGSSVGSNTTASIAVENSNFCALKTSTDFAAFQCACHGFGSSLDATANTNLYNAIQTYMTAVGA